jgi:glycosyltransferase involved in cell wall biosynthesis
MNLGELVKSDKFSIVYYGIPNDTSKGGIEKCLKNQDLEILKIGTIGRIVEQKDYPTLIRAFSFYKTMSNSSELLVVGDGILKKKMVAFSKELKVDSSITWLGRLSDVKLMLNKLDIFVLASRYEGFGLVLLEAMQSKTPIIAANNSAISEVLGLNYPGLFETGNSLDLYSKLVSCQSSSFRNLLLSFAGNRLNLFDSKKMCSEVVKIYDVAVCNFTKIK